MLCHFFHQCERLLIVSRSIVFVHGLFGHREKTWTTKRQPEKRKATSEAPKLSLKTTAVLLQVLGFGKSKRKIRTRRSSRLKASSRPRRDEPNSSPINSTDQGSNPEAQSPLTNPTVFWPKDLLPISTRQARIYSWGYDADINHFFGSAGQNAIFQHGLDLLQHISNARLSPDRVCGSLT